jgi:hypothetical protein
VQKLNVLKCYQSINSIKNCRSNISRPDNNNNNNNNNIIIEERPFLSFFPSKTIHRELLWVKKTISKVYLFVHQVSCLNNNNNSNFNCKWKLEKTINLIVIEKKDNFKNILKCNCWPHLKVTFTTTTSVKSAVHCPAQQQKRGVFATYNGTAHPSSHVIIN